MAASTLRNITIKSVAFCLAFEIICYCLEAVMNNEGWKCFSGCQRILFMMFCSVLFEMINYKYVQILNGMCNIIIHSVHYLIYYLIKTN
jgi:hypothetical protein